MHLKMLSNNISLKGIKLIHGFRTRPVASAYSNKPLVEVAIVCPDCSDLSATLLHGHCGIKPRLTWAFRCQLNCKAANCWHTLTNAVLLHVQLCGDCRRNKGATERSFGKALPLRSQRSVEVCEPVICCRAAPYQVRLHLHLCCGGQANQNGPLRSYC